jgi:hypothetical protein
MIRHRLGLLGSQDVPLHEWFVYTARKNSTAKNAAFLPEPWPMEKAGALRS